MTLLCPSPWHDAERLASAGYVCQTCADGIALDARDAAEVYNALVHLHAPTSQGLTERLGAVKPASRRVPYDDEAGRLRTVIQRTLERWAAVVVRGRSLAGNQTRNTIGGMADTIALHADWLARQTDAASCAAELRELARGAAYRMTHRARRTTAQVQRVTTCPVVRCGAQATAYLRRESSWRAAEVVCTANPDHAWDSGHWLELNPNAEARIGTPEAAIVIWGDDSQSSRDCVRQYVSRGKLTRGDDGLFSLREVGALARSMWPVTAEVA